MRNNRTILAATAVLITLCGAAGAKTVIRTETAISPATPPAGGRVIDFSVFDKNHDGDLSKREVGEELFHVFDRDGNEVIDNHEFDRQALMTIAPMKKETLTVIDRNADGDADETAYTYQNFLKQSELGKFSSNYTGLSPKEFTGSSFLRLDDNSDNAVDLQEWTESYLVPRRPPNAEPERYND